MNKAILSGNVGKDAEVKVFDNGNSVANFSLATTESWKDKESGKSKESTEWHNVVVYGSLVKVVEQYVKKGTRLLIEGKIKTRSYDDANGVKKYVTEIIMSNMEFIGSKPADNSQEQLHQNYTPQQQGQDEDLPF